MDVLNLASLSGAPPRSPEPGKQFNPLALPGYSCDALSIRAVGVLVRSAIIVIVCDCLGEHLGWRCLRRSFGQTRCLREEHCWSHLQQIRGCGRGFSLSMSGRQALCDMPDAHCIFFT